MAGRPKTRQRREEQARRDSKPKNHNNHAPRHKYLADIYAEKYTTFDALRQAMILNGIVEHGINPYEVIQRAIDDTTTDYLLLRRQIDRDSHGDPTKLVDHPLYDYMEHMREAMVRYSTFAMQYDIQKRQIKLSETRVAVLAVALKTTLTNLGLNHDQIKQTPRLLIEAVKSQEPKANAHANHLGQQRFDETKATALAEILHHDAEVEIIDVDQPQNQQ
jgi:hypothetical protein